MRQRQQLGAIIMGKVEVFGAFFNKGRSLGEHIYTGISNVYFLIF